MASQIQISAADAAKVEAFKEFITDGTSAESLKRDLNRIYVQFTRLLVKYPDEIRSENNEQLYYLSELIEILECGE